MIVLVDLSEGTMGRWEKERMLESEKYWNIVSVCKDNTMQYTINYWIIEEQYNREKVNNRGVNLIKV
jgi:hypothetical protein